MLLVDLYPGQIDAIEHRRSGGFALNVALEVFATNLDGTASEIGSGTISDHPVTREDWLAILEQTKYRQTMLVELAVPDAQTAPHLVEALGYLADARRRSLEGEHRLRWESLRQALASIKNMPPEAEDDTEAVMAALKGGPQPGASDDRGLPRTVRVGSAPGAQVPERPGRSSSGR